MWIITGLRSWVLGTRLFYFLANFLMAQPHTQSRVRRRGETRRDRQSLGWINEMEYFRPHNPGSQFAGIQAISVGWVASTLSGELSHQALGFIAELCYCIPITARRSSTGSVVEMAIGIEYEGVCVCVCLFGGCLPTFDDWPCGVSVACKHGRRRQLSLSHSPPPPPLPLPPVFSW